LDDLRKDKTMEKGYTLIELIIGIGFIIAFLGIAMLGLVGIHFVLKL
jgi:type II secretory pathway pseudopilin PulG